MLQVGDEVPEFEVENQDGVTVREADIEDAIVYFYPKAGTPGCTKEACSFSDSIQEFEDAGIAVYGVSVDSVEDQKAFHDEYDIGFDLLADEEGKVAEKFGVLHGDVAERTTFLVREGKVEKVFRDVDPEEHVGEVIEYLD
ncbi:MAG: peroxiredoxin [Candidatus Nanohaloarchaea archaeon]